MRRGLWIAAAATVLASCMPERSEILSGSNLTIPLHLLPRVIRNYRGRVIRTCGERLSPVWKGETDQVVGWNLLAQNPDSRFDYMMVGVEIAPCGSRRPRLIDGCISGRVAREDGSLDEPETSIVTSHLDMDSNWSLHPICTAR